MHIPFCFLSLCVRHLDYGLLASDSGIVSFQDGGIFNLINKVYVELL